MGKVNKDCTGGFVMLLFPLRYETLGNIEYNNMDGVMSAGLLINPSAHQPTGVTVQLCHKHNNNTPVYFLNQSWYFWFPNPAAHNFIKLC